ncbi:MAG: hypothetical protein AB1Z57_03490 [Acidimicrobiia bacterium]
MNEAGPIRWRLHLASEPTAVFAALDDPGSRSRFWADEAPEVDGTIRFRFANGVETDAPVLTREPPTTWVIGYFDTRAAFRLEDDGHGGTDLTMTCTEFDEVDRASLAAGWLNVLLPLKAWVDHGVDLHNHDPSRTWDDGYADH